MSYAAAGHAANAGKYQEMQVIAASPGQLVVMVYDHLLVSLRRARMAMERGDVGERVAQLDKVRNAISELLVTLDLEKGGAIAAQLSGLYTFFLAELLDVGPRNDVERLDRIATMVEELRDAFAQIAHQPRDVSAA
ncbi:MAG TPA: flagellar export chaperone FliS [Gemmatimonadaceae bacterium]|nr:flagellar export chaperone FliS [Gemmatimonadaceae bacterium]